MHRAARTCIYTFTYTRPRLAPSGLQAACLPATSGGGHSTCPSRRAPHAALFCLPYACRAAPVAVPCALEQQTQPAGNRPVRWHATALARYKFTLPLSQLKVAPPLASPGHCLTARFHPGPCASARHRACVCARGARPPLIASPPAPRVPLGFLQIQGSRGRPAVAPPCRPLLPLIYVSPTPHLVRTARLGRCPLPWPESPFTFPPSSSRRPLGPRPSALFKRRAAPPPMDRATADGRGPAPANRCRRSRPASGHSMVAWPATFSRHPARQERVNAPVLGASAWSCLICGQQEGVQPLLQTLALFVHGRPQALRRSTAPTRPTPTPLAASARPANTPPRPPRHCPLCAPHLQHRCTFALPRIPEKSPPPWVWPNPPPKHTASTTTHLANACTAVDDVS